MKKNYETLYYFFERERKEIKRDKERQKKKIIWLS
jgi:hypothetical protein